jgi:hypothetical protein
VIAAVVLAAAGGGTGSLFRLLLTVASATACYVIASRKGRNRALWSLAGLVSVLAVPVVAVLPRSRRREPQLPT